MFTLTRQASLIVAVLALLVLGVVSLVFGNVIFKARRRLSLYQIRRQTKASVQFDVKKIINAHSFGQAQAKPKPIME